MPAPDPRAISIQQLLDNWSAKNLPHVPKGNRGTLTRSMYAQQGFLARVAQSAYAEASITAGAWSLVFTLLDQEYARRVTADLDIDLPQVSTEAELRDVLKAIIETPVPSELDDHLVFESEFSLKHILPGTDVGGYRTVLIAKLGPTTRIKFTLDIALAFRVVPSPEEIEVPRLLQPSVTIPVQMAPIEAVLAGKVASLLRNGFRTTRVKDFYDCWLASQLRDFEGNRMIAALQSTCEQQKVTIAPEAEVFTSSTVPYEPWQQERWATFLEDHWIQAPAFPEAVQALRALYSPVLDKTAENRTWLHHQQQWSATAEVPEKEL